MSEPTNQSGLSRRAVAKGAAWSVPAVVAVGAAAPAYAISGPKPTFTYKGACKFPGEGNGPKQCGGRVQKGYGIQFTIKNNDATHAIYICNPTISNISPNPDNLAFTWVPPTDGTGCIKVAAGATVTVNFFFNGNKSSANQVFTFDFKAQWAHSCPCSSDTHGQHPPIVQTGLSVTGTPPNCSCSDYQA